MRCKRGHQHHHMVCHLGSLVLMWSVISVVCHGLGAWSVISVVCHGSGGVVCHQCGLSWIGGVVCHQCGLSWIGAWSVISVVCHGSGGVVCHQCGLSWIWGRGLSLVWSVMDRGMGGPVGADYKRTTLSVCVARQLAAGGVVGLQLQTHIHHTHG